jgi:hypothetical protein
LLAGDDLGLVGEASNGAEAERACGQVRSNLLLMELVKPGVDGAARSARCTPRMPRSRSIALATFLEEDLAKGEG